MQLKCAMRPPTVPLSAISRTKVLGMGHADYQLIWCEPIPGTYGRPGTPSGASMNREQQVHFHIDKMAL